MRFFPTHIQCVPECLKTITYSLNFLLQILYCTCNIFAFTESRKLFSTDRGQFSTNQPINQSKNLLFFRQNANTQGLRNITKVLLMSHITIPSFLIWHPCPVSPLFWIAMSQSHLQKYYRGKSSQYPSVILRVTLSNRPAWKYQSPLGSQRLHAVVLHLYFCWYLLLRNKMLSWKRFCSEHPDV